MKDKLREKELKILHSINPTWNFVNLCVYVREAK